MEAIAEPEQQQLDMVEIQENKAQDVHIAETPVMDDTIEGVCHGERIRVRNPRYDSNNKVNAMIKTKDLLNPKHTIKGK